MARAASCRTRYELASCSRSSNTGTGGAAEMAPLIKIDEVEALDGHCLRISFSDGAVKEVDVGALLAEGGVFTPIRDRREIFEQVRVNPETQTIEWPGEVDLD